mmetsp:Transcript_69861/g.158517  ORF Transcript_69861/g.158517 Transcript_69861/m.158517 type:complete len:309 (-) Transcript_69861:186-1112(-)
MLADAAGFPPPGRIEGAESQDLSKGVRVNDRYVCVYAKEVNIREDFELDSPVVRRLRHGDTVRGRLLRLNARRHLRLQLEDGTWTSVHAGSSSDPFLRIASLLEAPYLCVHDSVNVRKTFHLDSSIVRTLKYGDVVRGMLTCTNYNRILRLLLDDGTWTSIHGGTPSEPLLRVGEHTREHFVCVESSQEVNVREGFKLDSKVVKTLRHGDVVSGVLTCSNSDGVVRLQLDDGTWTSIKGREGAYLISVPRLLRERAQSLEHSLCQVCMDRSKCMAFGCGHQSCQVCAVNLKTCPECRTSITTRIRLYP